MSRGADRRLLRHLIRLSLFLGGGVTTALSLLTYARRDVILAGLTTHVPIREACKAVFPVVLLTQVLKGLAYPVNGVIMGGLDWTFSTAKMWLANAACLGLLRYFSVTNVSAGGGGGVTLGQIWVSLAVFFATQVVAGIVRYESKTGVWKVLRRKEEDGDETELQAVAS
jgi:Na+-driven multidrug efflux pump